VQIVRVTIVVNVATIAGNFLRVRPQVRTDKAVYGIDFTIDYPYVKDTRLQLPGDALMDSPIATAPTHPTACCIKILPIARRFGRRNGSVGRRGYWRGRWSGSGSSNGARRRAGGHGCGDEYRER